LQALTKAEQQRSWRVAGPFAQRLRRGSQFGLHRRGDRGKNAELAHLAETRVGLCRAFAGDLAEQRSALGRGQPLEEHEERQRKFAAREIRAECLADARLVAEEIDEVVRRFG